MKMIGAIVLFILIVLLGIDSNQGKKNNEKAITSTLIEKGYSDILFMPAKSYEFSHFKCKSFVEKQYPQEFKIAAVKNGEMRRIVACMGDKQTKYYDKKEEQPTMPSWVEEDGSMKEYSVINKDK